MEQIPLDDLRALSVDDKEYIGALERQLTDLRRKTSWIPCSERLPENAGWYQVTVIDFNHPVGIRGFDGDKFSDLAGITIAWQPLPEPYKEEK